MTAAAASGIRRPDRIYLLTGWVQGALFAAWGLSALAWWVVDLGLSPIRLVLLGTAVELAVLLAESPTGAVADTYSRKWSQIISWLLMGFAAFATPLFPNLALLLLWQALFGLGYTFQSGADLAWVTDEMTGDRNAAGSQSVGDAGREPESVDHLVLRHAMWRLVGVACGLIGAVSVLAVTDVSIEAVMMVAGGSVMAFGLVLAVIMPENHFTPAKDRSEGGPESALSGLASVARTWKDGLALMRSRRALRVIVILTVVISAADEMVDRLDLVRLVDLGAPAVSGDATAVWFGLAWLAMTLVTIPTIAWLNRCDLEQSNAVSARTVAALTVVGGTGILLMAIGPLALAVVGWATRDVMRETVEPVIDAWTNRNAESEVRATALSFKSQAMAAGEIGGGLILGGLAELVPLWLVFGIGAALYLAGAWVSLDR